MPIPTSGTDSVPFWKTPVAFLTLGLGLLRLVYLAFPNLFPEEAYYWLYARHLDYGYLDHPPMVAWLIALGTAGFGDTGFGVRLPAFICSLFTAFFVFKLTALLYGRRAAGFAVLIVQLLPFYFLVGFVMTPDAPLTACWSGMLYFLARVIFQSSLRAWLGVGVCLGLGMLSKYTIALLGPATLLFLALDPASRFWFRRAAPYLGVALSVVIFSPVIRWNEVHHWASFAFQTTGRTRVRRHFALHELAGSILAVLTPLPLYLAALALFTRHAHQSPSEMDGDLQAWSPSKVDGDLRAPLAPTIIQSPALDSAAVKVPITTETPPPLLPPPIGENLRNLRITSDLTSPTDDFSRRRLFAQIFTLVPLSVFILFSLAHRVKLNWTGPLWLAIIPAVAAQLAALTRRGPETATTPALRYGWYATVAFCAVAYAACLQHLSFGLPGVKYSRDLELLPVGWSDLSIALEQQKTDLARTTGTPIYLVGMDKNFIASEASFYQTNQTASLRETTGAHLFGADSLMYRYWFPPASLNGATLLLVGFDPHELDSGRIKNYCRESGPIQKYSLSHQGKPIRPYYTRVAYGYQAIAEQTANAHPHRSASDPQAAK